MDNKEDSARVAELISTEPADRPSDPNMVWVGGGVFRMGSEEFYPEERPFMKLRWMDSGSTAYEVTNDDFARFVRKRAINGGRTPSRSG